MRLGGGSGGRGIYVIMTDSMDVSLSKLLEIVKDREAWSTTVHSVANRQELATEQQQMIDSGCCMAKPSTTV